MLSDAYSLLFLPSHVPPNTGHHLAAGNKTSLWGDGIFLLQTGDLSQNWFANSQLKSCDNFCCCNFYCNDPVRSHFCTCHDSWAVMTCAKLWPDQTTISHLRAHDIFISFGLWAHKPPVKWILWHIRHQRPRSWNYLNRPDQCMNNSAQCKKNKIWYITILCVPHSSGSTISSSICNVSILCTSCITCMIFQCMIKYLHPAAVSQQYVIRWH